MEVGKLSSLNYIEAQTDMNKLKSRVLDIMTGKGSDEIRINTIRAPDGQVISRQIEKVDTVVPDDREFPDCFDLVGKKIQEVALNDKYDEGLVITCDDGTALSFGFSGAEGIIEIKDPG